MCEQLSCNVADVEMTVTGIGDGSLEMAVLPFTRTLEKSIQSINHSFIPCIRVPRAYTPRSAKRYIN